MRTPIRRLDGITYWVIEDPDEIYDYINTEIRREWESDARSEDRDPNEDKWLQNLPKLKWSLEIVDIGEIKLNPAIMNYIDKRKGYSFSESLEKRRMELQQCIQEFGLVIWPVIVNKEDFVLVDGYCRYAALKALSVRKLYAYVGAPQHHRPRSAL